jgi:hypothetical protein
MPTFITNKGKKKNINLEKYKIDWDGKSLSKFQFQVKQFLRPYWDKNNVYEEVLVAGTRMHIDLYNKDKSIAIEIDGAQHDDFSEFFHQGSRTVYRNQIVRDEKKEEFCRLNHIDLVRIKPGDLKNLSKEWFLERGASI